MYRHTQLEVSTTALSVGDKRITAHRLHQRLHHRQANSTAGMGPHNGVIAAHKTFKDLITFLQRHPWTMVANVKDHLISYT